MIVEQAERIEADQSRKNWRGLRELLDREVAGKARKSDAEDLVKVAEALGLSQADVRCRLDTMQRLRSAEAVASRHDELLAVYRKTRDGEKALREQFIAELAVWDKKLREADRATEETFKRWRESEEAKMEAERLRRENEALLA